MHYQSMTNSITMIAAFFAFLLVSSSFASSATTDSPFIVAHKKATITKFKNGEERVSVSIDIYNHGSATVYDVSLTDDTWPQDIFNVVGGTTSMSWERLEGDSFVSCSFELEPKVKGVFSGAPAVIRFRVPTKADVQEAYSTPILSLDILADSTPKSKPEWALGLLEKIGPHLSAVSFVALLGYIIATPSKSKGSKKRQ